MRIFACGHCGHPVFFENVQCLNCGSALAFLPDRLEMAAVSPPDDNGLLQPLGEPENGRRYRMCHNHGAYQACNFAVPEGDPQTLCVSCRQTHLLPDLSVPANQDRWTQIELAKRRLFYTLAQLGLEQGNPGETMSGPEFRFLADLPGEPPVMTGHQNGVITLNVAEADDDERAKRRIELREPYRTLLGHLRHECGHYYWPLLFTTEDQLQAFRSVFGDERQDYGEALKAHYAAGLRDNWQADFVSAYAMAHPWEDWAETWAHYLHMVDLLETASAYHTRVEIPGVDAPQTTRVRDPFGRSQLDFETLVRQWVPVTLLVNSLNRSLGQNDAYPFALTPGAMTKLRYVHDVVAAHHQAREAAAAPAATAPAVPPLAEVAAQQTGPSVGDSEGGQVQPQAPALPA